MEKFNLESLVKQRKNDEIKAMLEKGTDPMRLVDDSGIPLLHLATQYNNLDLLKYLVDKGLDVNVKTWVGSTPLEIAVFYNQFEAMKILLQAGADIFRLDNNGRSTLAILKSKIRKCPKDLVDLIIYNYQRNELDRETKAIILVNTDCTLKFVLSLNDTVATIVYLERNSYNLQQQDFNDALRFAMRRKDADNVKVILEYMNKENACNSVFFQLLNEFFLPVKNRNYLTSAELFLKKSIEWNIIDKSIVRIYENMFESSKKQGIKILMESNVDSYIRKKFGFEILTHLFCNPKVDAIDLVKNRSFLVNGKNTRGDTALHVAVRNYSVTNVKFLLDMGANPNGLNAEGVTPLYGNFISVPEFYKKVLAYAELLLLHGADVQLDNSGSTIFSRMNRRFLFNCKFLTLIIAQLAIDNARGVPIQEKYRNSLKYRYCNLFVKCSDQIEQFKKFKLSDSITLFTFLQGKSEELALRLRGENYFSKLKDYCQRRQVHPFYRTTLKFKLAAAYDIYFARCNFAEMISQSIGIPIAFDHLVIDKIFSFLTYYDVLQLT